jgi:hypothetical protein
VCPRFAAHLRDPDARGRRQPQGGSGDGRARKRHYHSRFQIATLQSTADGALGGPEDAGGVLDGVVLIHGGILTPPPPFAPLRVDPRASERILGGDKRCRIAPKKRQGRCHKMSQNRPGADVNLC